MGTSAVIGRLDGSAYRGRSVYYDGYPTRVGPALLAMLAARAGDVEGLLRTLLDDHYEWAVLDHTQGAEPDRSGGPVRPVSGVGLAYEDASPRRWVAGTLEDPRGEWLYLFDLIDGVSRLLVVSPRGRVVASLFLDAPPPSSGAWAHFERLGEPPR